MIAAHTWHHEPLRTLRDLIDIAAISARVDKRELDRTAAAWGLGRLWRTTDRAIEALFYSGRKTFPLRTWSRHLVSVETGPASRSTPHSSWTTIGACHLHVATVLAIYELRIRVKPGRGES